tara:strand:+ start:294 stop:983 length:690 start_codon:yes stop_codon:yes gene_type:complete
MKLLMEQWRNYLKEEEGIGCPIRGGNYGGIPSGGDFLATTEYEVAASNIAEAAHCILGSLGKRIGALAGDMDKSEWQGMVYGEKEHLTEEIGIIVKALKEYQRDVYTRQINDIEQYKPQFQDRMRKTNDKMVADIREKAPKLIDNAEEKLARLNKVEDDEPDFPQQVMAVGRLSYQLLISLSESLLKSVENWEETKQIQPELNAYKNKELQTLGFRLNGAIKTMIKELS